MYLFQQSHCFLVLVFESSYTPAHPALLNVALAEIRSVIKSLHNLLRCLFFQLPIQVGKDEMTLSPGALILPSLMPHIYAILGALYSETIEGTVISFDFLLNTDMA